jgi:uncharacterized OB-fold protein
MMFDADAFGLDFHFTVSDQGAVRLHGSVCSACGSRWFPRRQVCARCAGAQMEPLLAGPSCTVYASTTVRNGASGFPVPYQLAYLEVDGLRVLAHLDYPRNDDPPRKGTAVRLESRTLSTDPPRATFVATMAADFESDHSA